MKKGLLLLLVSFNVAAQAPIIIETPTTTTVCTVRGNVVYCW
jgi:hypothetical protein